MDRSHYQRLAQWTHRCNPDRVLSPDELAKFYVPLDAFRTSDGGLHALRGPGMADTLTQTIQLAADLPNPQSAQLFAGFRGTGKSTELLDVAHRLRATGYFTVLHVDFKAYFSERVAPTAEELGLILVAGVEEAAQDEPALAAVRADPVWSPLSEWWNNHKLELNPESAVKVGPVEVKALLKQGDPRLRERLRVFLGDTPQQLQRFVHDRIAVFTRAAQPGQLVVLLDNLEKFFATPEEVVRIYHDLAALFYHQVDLLHIPTCHVVYTVPPYLGFLNRGLAGRYTMRVLPSVKVAERPPGRAVFEPGLEALIEVLRRRVDLPALFGRDWRKTAALLAVASGGHMRDLLNLANKVILAATRHQLPISLAEVEQIIGWMGSERANPMWRDLGALLRQVADTGSLQGLNEGQLGALTRAMDEDLVLCFYNGQPWYDIHPLVLPWVPPKEG